MQLYIYIFYWLLNITGMSHLTITIFWDITACMGKPHARAYKFLAIIMRGPRNISQLRCSIFETKTKWNASPLFFNVCCFNGLQQSHTEFKTNAHICQLYKNVMFCFSNTHNTNSQQTNSAIPRGALLQHIQQALHLARTETFNLHLAYYIRNILTSKLFLLCIWRHDYHFTMKTKGILNQRGKVKLPCI